MVKVFWTNKSVTLRLTFLFIALAILSFASVFLANTTNAASLKSVSVVNSDRITLGDLFDNVGQNADYVIGAAPQPGEDMTLNARTLYRIASALDMSWRPQTTGDQITIRREAVVVTYNTIESQLRNALKGKGIDGAFNVKLTNGKPTIILPNNTLDNVEVSSIEYDRNRDYFTATLMAPSIDNPIEKMKVSGLVDRLTMVPVLSSTLQYGDVVGDADIQMVEISQDDIQHNMITNKDDMVGMTPRRIAPAGKFLQKGSMIKPQLVKRGESVSITFKEGPLVLTAKGKALQSGAKGDIVRVTNANSSRTVDAIVDGTNQVIVQ